MRIQEKIDFFSTLSNILYRSLRLDCFLLLSRMGSGLGRHERNLSFFEVLDLGSSLLKADLRAFEGLVDEAFLMVTSYIFFRQPLS